MSGTCFKREGSLPDRQPLGVKAVEPGANKILFQLTKRPDISDRQVCSACELMLPALVPHRKHRQDAGYLTLQKIVPLFQPSPPREGETEEVYDSGVP